MSILLHINYITVNNFFLFTYFKNYEIVIYRFIHDTLSQALSIKGHFSSDRIPQYDILITTNNKAKVCHMTVMLIICDYELFIAKVTIHTGGFRYEKHE